MSTLERVRADFDRIARLIADERERADPYDAFVLAQIPPTCRRLLEVGCGAGRLARAAAKRGAEVTAIDLSPEMIAVARARASGDPRLRLVCGDFMTHPLETAPFDAVLAVATLHHLEGGPALARLKALTAPGGVLVVHDLRAFSGPVDRLVSGLTAAVRGDAWHWMRSHLRQSRALRGAWHAHGADERYPRMAEVHALCRAHLPGVTVHRHALSRYTAVWRRPVAG
jgi:SAM-dependent methyltransferase